MAPPERTAGRPPWRSSASLRRQILGLLAALVLLVLAGSVAAILLLVRQTEQEDWRGRQAEATRRVAEAVGDFVSRQQNLLQVLDSPGRDELMRGDTELDSLLRRQPALLDLVYLRHDGEVLAAAPAGATVLANLFTIVQSKWFLAARGGEDYIGDVQMSVTDEPYLIIALPAADRAVIAARLRMDVLGQVIASLHFGRTGIAYVVNRQGRVIAHSDPQAVRDHVRLNEGSPLLSAARSGDSPVAGEYLNFAGESVVGTLLRIPGTPWVAVTELSWAEAYVASRRALVISVAAAVLFSAVLFIVGSALLERRLLRPLRHLHQGVARIGEGDLGHRIAAGGAGEIGSLAEAFNGMALRLQDRDRELARRNEALEQSEARYRAIVEDQSELICRFAPDGRLTFVNDAFCRYFGRSREDILDHRFDPLVPEEDQRRRQRHLAQLHPHGPVANIEHRAILAGGEVRWQQWTDRAIFDASGQLMEYASVGRDITERRSAEEELRNRSAQEGLLIALALRFINIHEGALDSGIDLVLAEVGRFVGADRAYQFRYDFPRDIMINTHEWCAEGITAEKDHLQAVPNDQLPSWVEAHRRGEPVQIPDLGAMPPDDSVRAILEPQGIKSLIVIPLRYGEECIGFVGFDAVRQHRSWTGTEVALLQILAELLVNAELKRRHELGIAEARRKLEESSLRANEMAQTAAAASQAKSRFLATMSHEIRTPMNGVLGMTELLLETPLDARQRHYATVLRESGEALLAIIDDVLDVSKIEAGRMEIERIAFDPRRLTERVLELLRPRAQAKGLAVALRVAAEVPPVLLGDPVRIRQILVNLLGNAIKFTERGGVEVELTARPLADREDGCLLRLRVTDSGIGIAAEVLPRLFQPFAQADNSTTRRFGGSGLGLAIVRQIVELMGGRVGVESEAGRGSVFWVEVPLVGVSQVATPQAAAPGRVAASPTGSVRVLVVDDCESNREILLHRLHKAG